MKAGSEHRKPSTQRIAARIRKQASGETFTPKDFHDLASSDTVRQILVRLVRSGMIRRVRRGVYEKPAWSDVLKGPAETDPDSIARAIARSHGWTIVPSGATALNRLGLSTQVPASWQYFSDGPTRTCRWTGGTITFRHRTNKETTGLSPSTALLVQALKALGKVHVDQTTIVALSRTLTASELNRAVREARYTTTWVYEAIRRLADHMRSTRG